MASSWNRSFDSSHPEIVYHDFITHQDKDGSTKECHKKCPLCKEFSKNFYCADCVNNGNYTLSLKKLFVKLPHKESDCLTRFADKKLNRYKLEEEKSVILERYKVAFAKKKEIENVKLNILLSREKIKILKQNIKVFRYEISKGQKKIDSLIVKKKESIELQEAFIQNTKKLRNTHKRKIDEICIKESDINTELCALQHLVKEYVEELVTVIFPITKVLPQHLIEKEKLEDAQKTTYVQGQWVIAGSPLDDIEYQIVAPRISCTGDYSAYPTWCSLYTTIKESEDYVEGIPKNLLSNSHKRLFDTAYGISSALTYIAQLVNLLAFFMDLHLPKRSNITDFSRDKYVKRFHHNVAKLNANIINLCLSQNIDVSDLSAHRTISNLLLFLDSMKNGNSQRSRSIRYLSLEESEELLESLEDSIFKDLPVCDDSDSDNVGADFVHLSDEDILEVPEAEPVSTKNADEALLLQNAPESLITSVMSFWKGGFGLG